MELLETEKVMSWSSRLKSMEVEAELKVDLKNAATVRGEISRTLPNSGCTMEFTTKTKMDEITGLKYLEVKRIA